jgi:hypothetical protein
LLVDRHNRLVRVVHGFLVELFKGHSEKHY